MDLLRNLEAFAIKFPDPDKKDACEMHPWMVSVAVEMYNMYHSYAKDLPCVVMKEETEANTCVRKRGDSPPNWFLNITRI